jgi:hypothetical protein
MPVSLVKRVRAGGELAKGPSLLEDVDLRTAGLLPDDVVHRLCGELILPQRLFLGGLGRGMTPRAAALRAGWDEGDADRIAEIYLTCDPVVMRLAAHIARLRELASMDGEEPTATEPSSVH